jgi:hypothetical protein
MMLGMARFIVFAFLMLLALVAVALISVFSAERGEVRVLPRGLWVAIILLIPWLGPAAYLWMGRPAQSALPAPRPESTGRVLAPDDDPEFLARIARGGFPGPAPRRTPNRDHPAGADRVDRTGASGSERDRKIGRDAAGPAGATGERGSQDDGRTNEDVPPTGA